MDSKPNQNAGTETFSFSSMASIAFLTLNTVFAAIRARHDLWTLAFIIAIYVLLMLLYLCLYIGEKLPENSKEKKRLRVPIWLLATTLNIMFAHRVSLLLPLGFALFVWSLALLSCTSTFYIFFIYKCCPDEHDYTSKSGYYKNKRAKIIKIHEYQPLPLAEV